MIERLFGQAPTAPESKLWLWRILMPPVRFIVFLFARVEIRGRENVPTSGPYMLAANHINWKDPPSVSLALGTPIRWMAKVEVFDYPFIGFLLRGIGNFAVRRGESDRRSVQRYSSPRSRRRTRSFRSTSAHSLLSVRSITSVGSDS